MTRDAETLEPARTPKLKIKGKMNMTSTRKTERRHSRDRLLSTLIHHWNTSLFNVTEGTRRRARINSPRRS